MIPDMPDKVHNASSVITSVDPGTEVEVRNAFDRSWSTGFVVSQITDAGYILRRASDQSELPRPVPFDAVRHQRRNSMWWV
jgi:hypothetical protein